MTTKTPKGRTERRAHLHLVGTEQTPTDQARDYAAAVVRMAANIHNVQFDDIFTVDEEPVTLEIAEVGILRKVSDEFPLAQATIAATDLDRPITFDVDWSTLCDIVGDSVRWIWIETTRGRQYALSNGFDDDSQQLLSWATRAVSGGWAPSAVRFEMTSAGLETST